MRVEGRSKISASDRPASASPPSPSARPSFSSTARSTKRHQTGAIELFSGEEVGSHRSRRSYGAVRMPAAWSSPSSAGTSSTAATARPTRPSTRGGPSGPAAPSERDPRAGQPRPLARVHRHALRRRVGRGTAAGVPAALAAGVRARVRGRLLPLADIAQLAREPQLGDRARVAGPDRLRRGRLEPDPGAGRRRRDLREPRTSRSRSESPSAARWPSPGSALASASPTCTPPPALPEPRASSTWPPPRRSSGPATTPRSSSAATSTSAPYAATSSGELERDFGLTGITAEDSIDHLLVRNVEVTEAARAWPPERKRASAGRRPRPSALRSRPGRA